MSKVEALIQEYCPEGVEYRALGEVCEMKRGTSATKGTIETGSIPVISGGKQPAFYGNVANRDGETITIAGSGAGAGFVQYWCEPIFVCDAFSVKGTSMLNTKYIYYYLANIQEQIYATKKGGGVPHVHISSIDRFEIPVPPLAVQEEIVRILDNFSLLSAELEAELEGRRKQYDFYRNQLLSFEANAQFASDGRGLTSSVPVQWKKLGEVCRKVSSGGTPTSSNRAYYQGDIPWLRTQEVDWSDIYDTELKITEDAVANSSAKLIPADCVIVAMYGATAAKVAINKIPLTTNQACCNLEIDTNKALYRYVFHWLSKEYQNLKSLGQGSQSNINAQIVKDYPIPIPPLAEQQRIVDILDRFDTLTNDLTSGLPAEIAARKQQYEYYRDKLLTFKRKDA